MVKVKKSRFFQLSLLSNKKKNLCKFNSSYSSETTLFYYIIFIYSFNFLILYIHLTSFLTLCVLTGVGVYGKDNFPLMQMCVEINPPALVLLRLMAPDRLTDQTGGCGLHLDVKP